MRANGVMSLLHCCCEICPLSYWSAGPDVDIPILIFCLNAGIPYSELSSCTFPYVIWWGSNLWCQSFLCTYFLVGRYVWCEEQLFCYTLSGKRMSVRYTTGKRIKCSLWCYSIRNSWAPGKVYKDSDYIHCHDTVLHWLKCVSIAPKRTLIAWFHFDLGRKIASTGDVYDYPLNWLLRVAVVLCPSAMLSFFEKRNVPPPPPAPLLPSSAVPN